VPLILDAVVFCPPDLFQAPIGFFHRPRPRERIVDRRHVVVQNVRVVLVKVEPFHDDAVIVVGHRHPTLVPSARSAHVTRFDFKRVVASVAVGIEPFADGIADESRVIDPWPRTAIGLDAPHSQPDFLE
jgi:hypothetical protein